MFSRFKKRTIRKDLLPLTTAEKNQYERVYREFIKHISQNNNNHITETFYLHKDTPFDIASWSKFLNKVSMRVGSKDISLGKLGKFSIQPMGEYQFLIFEPNRRTGGKKRQSEKRKSKQKSKKSKQKQWSRKSLKRTKIKRKSRH